MKVIFLDHDGVICLQDNWGSRHKKWDKFKRKFGHKIVPEMPVEYRFDHFDRKAIKTLNEILIETGAEIVVSSDWKRHATLEEIGQYYEMYGIIKKPIALTEKFNDIEDINEKDVSILESFPWRRDQYLAQERHFEILHWLNKHPEVTHWVAIDDLNMSKFDIAWNGETYPRSWGLTNFVHTTRDREGIKQTGKKEEIISFLNLESK